MRRSKRNEGYLTELKSMSFPTNFLFFDTETYIVKSSAGLTEFPFRIGVAIYLSLDDRLNQHKREVIIFKSAQEFLDILKTHNRKKKSLVIMAHNIGFDIQVLNLPELLYNDGYTSEPPIIKERAFIWDVKSNHGTYKFLDTSNFGVQSVEQLGKDLDFPKLKIKFDTTDEASLITYCQRDTEILERFMLNYIRYLSEHDLGSFRSTLASQALCAYRTRFITNPPYIHNDSKVITLERDAYHGGRVECFHIGTLPADNYYYMDVNSMYPYAMYQDELPIKLIRHDYYPPVKYLKLRMSKFYVIARVVLKTTSQAYPYIHENKLLFPTGEFVATLCQPELQYALEHNHIEAIIECACYTKGSLFKGYIDFFYEAKAKYTQEVKLAYRYISKIFLVSLYGKFGQLETIRTKIADTEFKGISRITGVVKKMRYSYHEISWFGTIYHEHRHGETAHSFPGLAAAITAKARMRLWELIEIAGLSNVFYSDTDSLIVNYTGYLSLKPYIDKLKLGYLKLEHRSKHLTIYGCKDYIFGKDVKVKGVPRKAKRNKDNTWSYLQFHSFKTYLNDGGKHPPRAHEVIKRRKSSYNKGRVDTKGKVSPLVFSLSLENLLIEFLRELKE